MARGGLERSNYQILPSQRPVCAFTESLNFLHLVQKVHWTTNYFLPTSFGMWQLKQCGETGVLYIMYNV